MYRTDYHTHTPLCHHAQGQPEEFVMQASQLGLHQYGIADHAPMPPQMEPYDDWRMLASELESYEEWICTAKEIAKGTNLQVLSGLECDWVPGIEPWIRELRAMAPWDYFIGSVHYLPGNGSVDDSIYANKCLTNSTDEDWRLYWQSIESMVRSGLFDIVGHIDLVKIWGRVPQGDLMAYYEPVLRALQDSGMAVEINTAGWHKHCKEQYPAIPLLKELLQRRIPIVIDSDAHYPQHLSRGWEDAVALLRQLTGNQLKQFKHPTRNGSTYLYAYGSL